MRAARETLAKRFHKGFAHGQECLAILDVLRFTLDENPIPALKALQNVRTVNSHWISAPDAGAFYAYGRSHWLERVQSQRAKS